MSEALRNGWKKVKLGEVAEVLSYSPDSMRTLINRGKFIAVKKGKDWFTHESLGLGDKR